MNIKTEILKYCKVSIWNFKNPVNFVKWFKVFIIIGPPRRPIVCRPGKYLITNFDTKTLTPCLNCHRFCESCTDSLITKCTTCPTKRKLATDGECACDVNLVDVFEKKCYDKCKVGEYRNRKDKKCNKCHPTCKEGCTGPLSKEDGNCAYC